MPEESRTEGDDLRSRRTLVALLLLVVAFAIRLIFVFIAPNGTTDAWSRYHYAVLWLQHPGSLPAATSTDAWLPLHIWLLGAVLWLTKSELGARIFTVVIGAATVVLFWSIVRLAFDRQVAFFSALVLAFFGFHIAFSVTTGSEAPTIFFVAAGIYGWLRFAADDRWKWAFFSALMFGAASLCRFEAWLCAPVLGLMLLDSEGGWAKVLSNRRQLLRAVGFVLLASMASLGWLIFSFLKWGDPLELPHRTMWLNLHFQPFHHSLLFRFFTVPIALLVSISPVIVGLACVGLLRSFEQAGRPARALAVLTLVLFAFNYWNSTRYEVTQARYTLLYSWLLIPFAFDGLRSLVQRWPRLAPRSAFAGVVVFFVLWQAGIVLGASYARPAIADRLAQMSPTLPLHHEMRELTHWILTNHPSGPLILDDYNWDSSAVSRITHLKPSETFLIRAEHYADQAVLRQELEKFMAAHHPEVLVAAPRGPIGTMWSVDNREQLEVEDMGIRLQRKWKSENWRVYDIVYFQK